MPDSFYSLGLTREQLAELHRSVLSTYIIDETFRRERGEESQDPPALLDHLEGLLEMTEQDAHRAFHDEEDRLWEYSWYAYTDEWAWHRARQETVRELGDELVLLNEEALEQRIEKTYNDHFERYTKEIDMTSSLASSPTKNTPSRRAKK